MICVLPAINIASADSCVFATQKVHILTGTRKTFPYAQLDVV